MISLQLSGVRLDGARYNEIEILVTEMFEECGLFTIPIDCFAIAKKLHYIVIPYSQLSPVDQAAAFEKSDEGFSRIEYFKDIGMYRYVIYYNDITVGIQRIRFTVFHEIGHCYLDHHSDIGRKSPEVMESEANFFAKTAIAPLPLINSMELSDETEISNKFDVSYTSSCFIFDAYSSWLNFGAPVYLEHELKLLHMFGTVA